MPIFSADFWAEHAPGEWHGAPPERVAGFAFDTRRLARGECFVALRTERRDGHDFVPDAAEGGAACAIVERPVAADLPQLVVEDAWRALADLGRAHRRRFGGPVIAVTGSSGKTTTKEMLRSILGATAHATDGNWNNELGVPLTLLDLAPDHQRFAVVEAGINGPGEMARLGRAIEADMAVLTTVGHAHLERLESPERVAEEKLDLWRRARPGAPLFLPLAARPFIADPAVDEAALWLAPEEVEAPFGLGVQRYRADIGADGDARLRLLSGPAGRAETFSVATASEGALANAALAVCVARRAGMGDAAIRDGLATWRPGEERGRWVKAGAARYYVDCYNANPDSMRDALRSFDRLAGSDRPRLYVLGAMDELGGAAAALHRSAVSRLPVRGADELRFVGPAELTAAYAEGAREAGFPDERIRQVETAEALGDEAAAFSGAVFLKGSRSSRLETLLPPELRQTD